MLRGVFVPFALPRYPRLNDLLRLYDFVCIYYTVRTSDQCFREINVYEGKFAPSFHLDYRNGIGDGQRNTYPDVAGPGVYADAVDPVILQVLVPFAHDAVVQKVNDIHDVQLCSCQEAFESSLIE